MKERLLIPFAQHQGLERLLEPAGRKGNSYTFRMPEGWEGNPTTGLGKCSIRVLPLQQQRWDL